MRGVRRGRRRGRGRGGGTRARAGGALRGQSRTGARSRSGRGRCGMLRSQREVVRGGQNMRRRPRTFGGAACRKEQEKNGRADAILLLDERKSHTARQTQPSHSLGPPGADIIIAPAREALLFSALPSFPERPLNFQPSPLSVFAPPTHDQTPLAAITGTDCYFTVPRALVFAVNSVHYHGSPRIPSPRNHILPVLPMIASTLTRGISFRVFLSASRSLRFTSHRHPPTGGSRAPGHLRTVNHPLTPTIAPTCPADNVTPLCLLHFDQFNPNSTFPLPTRPLGFIPSSIINYLFSLQPATNAPLVCIPFLFILLSLDSVCPVDPPHSCCPPYQTFLVACRPSAPHANGNACPVDATANRSTPHLQPLCRSRTLSMFGTIHSIVSPVRSNVGIMSGLAPKGTDLSLCARERIPG